MTFFEKYPKLLEEKLSNLEIRDAWYYQYDIGIGQY